MRESYEGGSKVREGGRKCVLKRRGATKWTVHGTSMTRKREVGATGVNGCDEKGPWGKRWEAHGGQTTQRRKGRVSDEDGPCKEEERGCAATEPYTTNEGGITAIGRRMTRKREPVGRGPNGCEAKRPRLKKGESQRQPGCSGETRRGLWQGPAEWGRKKWAATEPHAFREG